jgi:hypothetical protein
MIIVKIWGGLGNQLFQYAFGRQLSERTGHELKLDLSWFRGQDGDESANRYFNLGKFAVPLDIATKQDIRRVIGPTGIPTPRDAARKFSRLSTVLDGLPTELTPKLAGRLLHYYWEIQHTPPSSDTGWPYSRWYCPDIQELDEDSYLAGYWQTERYFDGIAETLRDELTVEAALSGRNADIARDIDRGTSIAVHVRRGDYESLGITLPLEYYERAVDEMSSRFRQPRFFVFSDDTEWARANLNIDWDTTYVDHNDARTDYEDLRLMRLCDHHIIANSTFSWWGAWLAAMEEQLVFAPADSKSSIPQNDFFPEQWARVRFNSDPD